MNRFLAIAVVWLAVGRAAAAEDVIVFLYRSPYGDVWVRAPLDDQARRKLSQGNAPALAINTRGFTHGTGAVRLGHRIIWTDAASRAAWLRRGAVDHYSSR
jgi:hypothetical protein